MEEYTFWMVYVDGAGSPKKFHHTLVSADQEAQRLAKLQNRKAYVLEAVAGYGISEPKIEPIQLVVGFSETPLLAQAGEA